MAQVPSSRMLSPRDLAQMIDISAVQAFHTEADVRDVAAVARAEGFVAVHALPNFTALLAELLPPEAGVLVGGPIGFPSGGSLTSTKVAEARGLVADGAAEVDMMMNIGRLKSGDDAWVAADLGAVIEAASPVPVKVIIEVSRLTDDEIRRAAALVAEAGAAFVKTGTGWTGLPTTLHHVRLIREAAGPDIGIKASGGIRDLDTVARMVAAGVTRFGINTQMARELIAECGRLDGGGLRIAG
ncbi:deoxyribose-phosphate aldolase [Amaricoccus sp.]|uniref:deoxyribose-phosphate aldolase n=1 Tax=Amaricoccus sp. TaxID=1872485 RepID=UPI001B50FE3F|nr:deoxyribose-phosphate aldolase [Amaricoccus sp.]MBP7002748.1 deoxyribose-phosphate aldolase [Amaricoccus sp.]